jgi:hypothetical protein
MGGMTDFNLLVHLIKTHKRSFRHSLTGTLLTTTPSNRAVIPRFHDDYEDQS